MDTVHNALRRLRAWFLAWLIAEAVLGVPGLAVARPNPGESVDGARESVAVHYFLIGVYRGYAWIWADNGPTLLNKFKDGDPSARPTPDRFTGDSEGTRQEVPCASLVLQPGISFHVFFRVHSIPASGFLAGKQGRFHPSSGTRTNSQASSVAALPRPSLRFLTLPERLRSILRVLTPDLRNRRASVQSDWSRRPIPMQVAHSK